MKRVRLILIVVLIASCLLLTASTVRQQGEIGTAIFAQKINGVWIVTES